MSNYNCIPYWDLPIDFQMIEKEGGDNIKRNYCGKILYEITKGVDKLSSQENSAKIIKEKFEMEKIPGYFHYPFNTQSKDIIKKIHAKINNVSIKMNSGIILSSVPIMLHVNGSILCLWTTPVYENRLLTNKGKSYIDGYNIVDFNNKKTKVEVEFNYKDWNIGQTSLCEIEINGSNNNISIDKDILSENISMKIFGKNEINVDCFLYKSLSIYNTYSNINLNNADAESFKVTIEGTGSIKNVLCTKYLDCTVIGDGELQINITKNTKINKKEFGGINIKLTPQ